jgi:hypothetical protein
LRIFLGLFLLASSLHAQVIAMATPETLASDVLHISEIGIWDIALANHSAHPVSLRMEDVLFQMPTLHRIDPARVQLLINRTYNATTRSRLIRILSYSDLLAGGLMGGGFIATTVTVTAAVALSGAVVHRFSDDLKAQQPDLAAFANAPDTITLSAFGDPGYGTTLTVYAGVNAHAGTIGPVTIMVPAPHAQLPVDTLNSIADLGWIRRELLGLGQVGSVFEVSTK